ncbi:MAG: ATP-binding protein [Planctomycetales bacterium]
MSIDNDRSISDAYVNELHAAAGTGKEISVPLDTDERVLARVTDGIYRQPGSAIRELLVNAYDADATEVAVVTDAPRYSEILVRDNGNGMTAPVLVNLIRHIGGSAKRTPLGQELGITQENNFAFSKGGRKLIGKIGIGLFSVSQLTRQFTIITKPKDEKFRYRADVTLHHYTDDVLRTVSPGKRFTSGKTVISSELADRDYESGTTILLTSIIPRAREILQSKAIWDAFLHLDQQSNFASKLVRPAIHSGFLNPDGKFAVQPCVPWAVGTKATDRMKILAKSMLENANQNELFAQTKNAFDYYFWMIWNLGLSLPLPYIDINPFDLPDGRNIKFFRLSNRTKATSQHPGDDQASDLKTGQKTTVAAATRLPIPDEGSDFSVNIDGLQLYRPIRYDAIPGTSRALKTPLLFVGGFNPDLHKYDKTQRGGEDLEFTGYFYWSPRVIPREHIGLLVRINGASGTLFDTTYLNYQIAERQRLAQLVGEVFVSKGLEEALNIDRESFNTAHPHYQILLNWVHNALRQVSNKQKALESDERSRRNAVSAKDKKFAVQEVAAEELTKILGDEDDTVRDVCFTDDPNEKRKAEVEGKRVFPSSVVIAPLVGTMERVGTKAAEKFMVAEEKAIGIAKILDAYGLLDNLTPDEQSQLLTSIIRVFITGEIR